MSRSWFNFFRRNPPAADAAKPGDAPAAAAPVDPRELLARAAACYARAQWHEDAGRLFLELNDSVQAASCLEKLGRWREAAREYANGQQWAAAARCWLQAREPREAAECLVRAGDWREAAWWLAESTGAFARADSLIDRVSAEEAAADVSVGLVRARIRAGDGRTAAAGELLRDALRRLAEMADGPRRQECLNRARIVVDLLRRPDLTRRLEQVIAGRLDPLEPYLD